MGQLSPGEEGPFEVSEESVEDFPQSRLHFTHATEVHFDLHDFVGLAVVQLLESRLLAFDQLEDAAVVATQFGVQSE